MAKIKTPSYIEAIKGKVDSDENVYYSERYGETYLCEYNPCEQEPTEAQLEHREKFRNATAQALADMKDPSKKAEWTATAKKSHKYKTARGCAFAHYYQDDATN